jgi:putative two-component system response regulator
MPLRTGLSQGVPYPRRRPTILVIDDDDAICRLIASLLAPEGYKVESAASAEEGLEKVAAAPPDLVLVDMHLPARSGFDVITEMRSRAHTRLTPVVMITGDASPSGKLRAIESGVTDFLAKPFAPEELVARARALLELKAATDALESAEDVIVSLARIIDARDPSTYGHSSRVSLYAGLLGERIGLDAERLWALRRGGLVHDIGKIAIRDDVLRKPGPLTSEELAEIRSHPARGRDLLINMKTLAATIPIVYHHHERMDGSGYPDGLAGEAIPLLARITTISDVFDALSMPRVYRRALRREEALQIMDNEARKGWWDGRLFDEFRAVLETLPAPDERFRAVSDPAQGFTGESSPTAPLRPAASAGRDELGWVL